MSSSHAVLIDGGFLTKVLRKKQKSYPKAKDILAECGRISQNERLVNSRLLRYYFYDAPPIQKIVTNPLSDRQTDLGKTEFAKNSQSLQDSLELIDDFAVRKGETIFHGWKLGAAATRDLQKKSRNPNADDFIPEINQKGVDLRIGLDIARFSLRRLVDIIVVVAGDSDLVPAFKFARREGLQIYLDHLRQSVNRELKAHADYIL